jgi:5'(3')-deoxyribonucleotidase
MIWFDLDGTIVDLYGFPGWLPMLRSYDPTPYREAKPLVDIAALVQLLHKIQEKGYKIGIITALAKNSTPDYDEAVIAAKKYWLHHYLKDISFDTMVFVPHWYVKNHVNTGNDILFDDETRHLEAWTGVAIPAKNMVNALISLAK